MICPDLARCRLHIVSSYLTEKMMAENAEEYEMGRRYLANMMGADPDQFSQQEVDVS